jgi:hypothetical protein
VPADEDINWPTSVSRLDGVLDEMLRRMRAYKPARGLTGMGGPRIL